MTATMAGLSVPSDRERAMRSIVELCAEHGYRQTSTEMVSERAGVSVKKFEKLFSGGKEECLIAAVNAILGEVMAVVSACYTPDRSEWDSGVLGIKAILELMAANPSWAHLAYVCARQEAPLTVREAHEAGIRLLGSLMERWRENSPTTGQPMTAARGGLGGAEAVIRREVMAGRGDQLPRLLPDLVYGATVPFLGQETALVMSRKAADMLAGTPWERQV